MNDGNIVLIGMPGAGKSTLGVVLAKVLNMDFIDTDLLIQHKCGKTLQHIIDEEGVDGFIRIEDEVLSNLRVSGSVIATGGSAVYSDAGMRHLAQQSVIVYLQISYESLVERLGDLHERGVVLKDGVSMSLRDLYDEREPLYRRHAGMTVDVDKKPIAAAVRDIAAAVA